jgi:hypothetical protein
MDRQIDTRHYPHVHQDLISTSVIHITLILFKTTAKGSRLSRLLVRTSLPIDIALRLIQISVPKPSALTLPIFLPRSCFPNPPILQSPLLKYLFPISSSIPLMCPTLSVSLDYFYTSSTQPWDRIASRRFQCKNWTQGTGDM